MRTIQWIGGLGFVALAGLPFLSCSSDSTGGSYSPGTGGSGASSGSGGQQGDSSLQDHSSSSDGFTLDIGISSDGSQFDPDAYWANDPPPAQCLDGGLSPVVPGGTPECPDDKNREGCACSTVGATAACWPGFRKNRNRGICKDGQTTCLKQGENQSSWGPCTGYVLPDPTATSGASACLCFSGGQWKLDNLSPCFADNGGGSGSMGAVSTIITGTTIDCPPISDPLTKPTQSWSPNTLKVDCAGHFKLCYALKAGTAATPSATDCLLSKVCVEADYPTPNVVQKFPDLPAWVANSAAEITCAEQFASTGGYGEMSVVGLSVECDEIDDGSGGEKVFNRVNYCPLTCNTDPTLPECQNCQSGGGGSF
jgi:hypothetical protein